MVVRQCCTRLLLATARHFTLAITGLASHFVPHPTAFLIALRWSGGYMCGGVAVAFLLQQPISTWAVPSADVVVPNDHRFHALMFHLLMQQNGRIVYWRSASHPEALVSQYGAVNQVHVRTSRGLVHVFQSQVLDPLFSITRSPLSAQMGYVSLDRFGAAYASLLFRRRSLLAELSRAFTPEIHTYTTRGFSIRLFVCQWADREEDGRCASYCGECPAQLRSFTDIYALHATTNPLLLAPITTDVAWRLDSRPCDGPCLLYMSHVLTFVSEP